MLLLFMHEVQGAIRTRTEETLSALTFSFVRYTHNRESLGTLSKLSLITSSKYPTSTFLNRTLIKGNGQLLRFYFLTSRWLAIPYQSEDYLK